MKLILSALFTCLIFAPSFAHDLCESGKKNTLYELFDKDNSNMVCFAPSVPEAVTCVVQEALADMANKGELLSSIPMTIYDNNNNALKTRQMSLYIGSSFTTTKVTVALDVKSKPLRFEYKNRGERASNGVLLRCFW